jgi:hypothetical protein
MNTRQFALLAAGLALAVAIVRYQPIRGGNPFYDPIRISIAEYTGRGEGYRPPAVSFELNGSAAILLVFGTVGGVLMLRERKGPRRDRTVAEIG